ncbi:MAG: carboxypeptidase-like regulatory domain-containing protein, partial [Mucilaginibacter sp.]
MNLLLYKAAKRLTLLVALLPFVTILYAQQKGISGRVIDSATNTPINGATVILIPVTRTTSTNQVGHFAFKDISQSKTITITAIG